jgi:TonB family protein
MTSKPMRALPALALLLAAAPLAAQADARATRWLTVLTGGDGTVVAIDSGSIHRTGDSTFTVRTAIRFPQAVSIPSGERVDREVDAEELDCGGGRTWQWTSEVYAGETRVKTTTLARAWAAVAPGRRAVFDASCAWLLGGFAARLPRSFDARYVEEQPVLTNRAAVSQALSHEYPRALREMGQTGTVTVRFRVLEDGTADRESVAVERSTHPDFSEAAVRVVYRMRFRAARYRGQPVPVWVTLPVNFNLYNGPGTPSQPPGTPPPLPPLPPRPRPRP